MYLKGLGTAISVVSNLQATTICMSREYVFIFDLMCHLRDYVLPFKEIHVLSGIQKRQLFVHQENPCFIIDTMRNVSFKRLCTAI